MTPMTPKTPADKAHLLRAIARAVTDHLPVPLSIHMFGHGDAQLHFCDGEVGAVQVWADWLGAIVTHGGPTYDESTASPWHEFGNRPDGGRPGEWHGWRVDLWCRVDGPVPAEKTSAEVPAGSPATAQVGMPARSVPPLVGATRGADHPTTAVEVEEPPSADGAESGSDAMVRHCGAGVVDGESAPAPAAPDSRSGAAGVTPATLSLALLNAAQTGQLMVGPYLSEAALAAVLAAELGTAFYYPGGGKPGPVGFILEKAGREHIAGPLGPCVDCATTLRLRDGVYVDESGNARCDATGRPNDGHCLGDPYIDSPAGRDLAETSGPAVATSGPSGDSSGEVETGQGTAPRDPSARDSASPAFDPRPKSAPYGMSDSVAGAWYAQYAIGLDQGAPGWYRDVDPTLQLVPELADEVRKRWAADASPLRITRPAGGKS